MDEHLSGPALRECLASRRPSRISAAHEREVIVRLAAGVLLGALAERVLVFELSFEVVKRSGVVTWKLASRAAREGSMCSAGGSVRPC